MDPAQPKDDGDAIGSVPAGRLRRAWRVARMVGDGVGVALVKRKAR